MSPRRGAGEGHIKKIALKSGRKAWRGWITVGYRANGTPIRRSVQRATRQAVQEGLLRLRERYDAGNLDLEAEAGARLYALLDRWIVHIRTEAKPRPKARTLRTYEWAADKIKAAAPGDPLVAKATPLSLQEIMGRLPDDLAPSSLNLCRTVLKGAFAQAMAWRLRPDNPAIGLALPSRERDEPERRIISPDDADRLLGALVAERFGLAAALTYAVAARPGEIAALRREDINLDAGTLTITASHNPVKGGVVREKPKSRRGVRTLQIPPELHPWVAQQIARSQNERAAMADEWTAPDEGLLFVRETDGGRIAANSIYRVARAVAEASGLGAVGPRILRRSMLSLLAARGVDPKVRAAIGGHTMTVTEKHYREVDQAELDHAMAQVRISKPILEQHPEQRDPTEEPR